MAFFVLAANFANDEQNEGATKKCTEKIDQNVCRLGGASCGKGLTVFVDGCRGQNEKQGICVLERKIALPGQKEEKDQCTEHTKLGHMCKLSDEGVDLLENFGLLGVAFVIEILDNEIGDHACDLSARLIGRVTALRRKKKDHREIGDDQKTENESNPQTCILFCHVVLRL